MSDIEKAAPNKKLSQRRIDRQQRKAERQRLRQKKAEFDEKKEKSKVVKVRMKKKSLPGFLANNVDLIIHWLRDYEHLFCLAEDYGFQRLDRLPDERRHQLVQQYVDIAEFIDMCEELKNAAAEKAVEKPEEQLKAEDQISSS